MARTMDVATIAAQESQVVREAFIVRLDIDGDEFLAWTGLGTYTPSGTGDNAIEALVNGTDAATYTGVAALGAIDSITDGNQGTRAVTLTLSGVSLAEDVAKQIIFEARKWQFRRGRIWGINLDENGVPVGNPWRIRTGRMENMQYKRGGDDGEATISVDLEGYISYTQEPLFSRYSEQKDLDATDTSQDFVHELANLDPTSSDGPSGHAGRGGRGGGGGGTSSGHYDGPRGPSLHLH